MTLNSDGRNPEELDEATPETATGEAAGDENDAQGHMFLPDRTAEYLAKARERDIRQSASRREMQIRGKSQGGRR